MSFWNKFPYTDFHELNLDWIINEIKKIGINVDDFIKNYKNPVITDDVNDITNTNYVYLYVGRDTTTRLNRHWYYYNPTTEEWVDGGLYGSAIVDDEFSTTSHNPLENKVITEKLNEIDSTTSELNQKIDNTNSDNLKSNSTPSYYSVDLNKMCKLFLPANHTAQAIEYLNGYLYVFHHINDTHENMVSKYLWETVRNASETDIVNPVDTLLMPYNSHGNSMSAYNNRYLIITDAISGARTVIIIDTNTFTVVNQFALIASPFDSCCIASNNFGTFLITFIEHGGVMRYYKLIDGHFILCYSRRRYFLNGAYPADLHSASRIYCLYSSVNIGTVYSGLGVYSPDGMQIGMCKFSNITNETEIEGLTKVSGDPLIYVSDISGNLYKTANAVEFPYDNTYGTAKDKIEERIVDSASIYTSMPSGELKTYMPELVTEVGGITTRYPITFGRNELAPGRQKILINIVYANGGIYENSLVLGNYGENGSIVKEYNGQRVKIDYTFHDTYLEITEVTHWDGHDTRTLTGGNLYSTFYVRVSAFDSCVYNADVCIHPSLATMFPA